MKNIFYPIGFIVTALLVLAACSGDDASEKNEMTDQQKATRTLKDGSPWVVQSVDSKPDGVSEDFLMDLQLSFGATGEAQAPTPTTFSSAAKDSHLSSEPGASWKWTDTGVSGITLENAFTSNLTNIRFNPGVENASSLTATFVLTAEQGGRAKGIRTYTVTFK